MVLLNIIGVPVILWSVVGTATEQVGAECSESGCVLPTPCDNPCGCDRSVGYSYNETSGNCELNEDIRSTMMEKYNSEEKIRLEAERVFAGVVASAILFIACAITLAVAACLYCCTVNYSDGKLRDDVKALAKRQGRELERPRRPRAPRAPPLAQSCNVIVQQAGVCVV